MKDVNEGEYKASVIVAWIILRSMAFCLDTCEEDPMLNYYDFKLWIQFLAYCLYLPLVVMGPFMPYQDFTQGVSNSIIFIFEFQI